MCLLSFLKWDFTKQDHPGNPGRVSGSGPVTADPSRRIQRSQSVRHTDPLSPIASSLYKSSAAKQKSLKNMFKSGSIKETMRRLISKFFIYESVPPQKADSHHFKNMIFGAQQAGLTNYIICFTL